MINFIVLYRGETKKKSQKMFDYTADYEFDHSTATPREIERHNIDTTLDTLRHELSVVEDDLSTLNVSRNEARYNCDWDTVRELHDMYEDLLDNRIQLIARIRETEQDAGELDRGELDRGELDRGELDRGELDRQITDYEFQLQIFDRMLKCTYWKNTISRGLHNGRLRV